MGHESRVEQANLVFNKGKGGLQLIPSRVKEQIYETGGLQALRKK